MPVQHCSQIKELIAAMMLPLKVAITECQAHWKGNYVICGNNAADEAATTAATCPNGDDGA